MNFAIAFTAALLNTLMLAALAKLVAGVVAAEKSARIAAFSFALGFTLHRYSGGGPPDRATALILVTALGAAVALLLLWFWLLRPLRVADVAEEVQTHRG